MIWWTIHAIYVAIGHSTEDTSSDTNGRNVQHRESEIDSKAPSWTIKDIMARAFDFGGTQVA